MSILLNLSGNHLTGSLPVEVGQLKALNSFDASRNMLSGNIPRSLSSCVSLEVLYMQENSFNGTIPDAFQTLKGLHFLDLSHNNLSGEIPKILTSLQLQSLILSHNNLEGEVPIEGVFRNATGILMNGNNRLCGGIPELQLPHCSLIRNTKKGRLEHRKKLIIGLSCGLFGFILLVASLVSLYSLWKKKETKGPTNLGDSENFPNLSYQTLRKATNEFSSENLIGSGAFGVVYKGTLQESGSIVAIKIFKLDYRGASKSFMAECKVLRSIRHRNLVKVVTTCSSVDYKGSDFKALVYEYMSNGSLDDWLHPTDEAINRPVEGIEHTLRKLNLYQRLDVAIDVAFALDYLHHHCGISLVHCDLKPSNVLLDGEMVAHVGDFGLAKFLSKSINNSHENEFTGSMGVRGTIGYTPPEYGLGNEVSTSGDVYSFGILILELITGKRPTNEMFKGGVSLHCFVKEALQRHVIDILDCALLEDINGQEIDSGFMLETLSSILRVAISCSTEVPHERMVMSDVVAKLLSIRKKLLEYSLQQRRRFQAGVY